MTKLSPPEQRLLHAVSKRLHKRFPHIPIYSVHDPPRPLIIEQSEHTRIGGPSRLAAQVRHKQDKFRHLVRIVISQNAPAWHRKALATDEAPKGLQSILIYDSECYRELWYKTATKGHRAKIFLR